MRYFFMPIIGLGVFAVLPFSLTLPTWESLYSPIVHLWQVMANDSERQFGIPTYN